MDSSIHLFINLILLPSNSSHNLFLSKILNPLLSSDLNECDDSVSLVKGPFRSEIFVQVFKEKMNFTKATMTQIHVHVCSDGEIQLTNLHNYVHHLSCLEKPDSSISQTTSSARFCVLVMYQVARHCKPNDLDLGSCVRWLFGRLTDIIVHYHK